MPIPPPIRPSARASRLILCLSTRTVSLAQVPAIVIALLPRIALHPVVPLRYTPPNPGSLTRLLLLRISAKLFLASIRTLGSDIRKLQLHRDPLADRLPPPHSNAALLPRSPSSLSHPIFLSTLMFRLSVRVWALVVLIVRRNVTFLIVLVVVPLVSLPTVACIPLPLFLQMVLMVSFVVLRAVWRTLLLLARVSLRGKLVCKVVASSVALTPPWTALARLVAPFVRLFTVHILFRVPLMVALTFLTSSILFVVSIVVIRIVFWLVLALVVLPVSLPSVLSLTCRVRALLSPTVVLIVVLTTLLVMPFVMSLATRTLLVPARALMVRVPARLAILLSTMAWNLSVAAPPICLSLPRLACFVVLTSVPLYVLRRLLMHPSMLLPTLARVVSLPAAGTKDLTVCPTWWVKLAINSVTWAVSSSPPRVSLRTVPALCSTSLSVLVTILVLVLVWATALLSARIPLSISRTQLPFRPRRSLPIVRWHRPHLLVEFSLTQRASLRVVARTTVPLIMALLFLPRFVPRLTQTARPVLLQKLPGRLTPRFVLVASWQNVIPMFTARDIRASMLIVVPRRLASLPWIWPTSTRMLVDPSLLTALRLFRQAIWKALLPPRAPWPRIPRTSLVLVVLVLVVLVVHFTRMTLATARVLVPDTFRASLGRPGPVVPRHFVPMFVLHFVTTSSSVTPAPLASRITAPTLLVSTLSRPLVQVSIPVMPALSTPVMLLTAMAPLLLSRLIIRSTSFPL